MRYLNILLLIAIALTNTAQAIELQGELTQGSLIFGQAEAGSKVKLNGKEVTVLPDGKFLFGFGRDAELNHKLEITNPNGKAEAKQIILSKREYKIERIDGLPKAKVNTPRSKELQARITREVREIGAARSHFTKEAMFDSGFIWPVTGRISGVYGSQRVLNGIPKRPHFGIDIAQAAGTEVIAPADGIVRMVQGDNWFSGGTMIMDHGYGLFSAFLHMQSFDVKVGDRLKQGDVIGEVGSTGRSTGPHLDWRMNWLKQRVDPSFLVSEMPK